MYPQLEMGHWVSRSVGQWVRVSWYEALSAVDRPVGLDLDLPLYQRNASHVGVTSQRRNVHVLRTSTSCLPVPPGGDWRRAVET